jgi:hypothetical protein
MSNIRTAFSTLLTLDAGKLESAAGVQDDNVDTTIGTKLGRSLINDDQLFKIADMMSGFLEYN